MSANVDKILPIKARPIITHIEPMFVRIGNDKTKITVHGHGFWSNKKKVIDGIETDQVEVPFYKKGYHEPLRVFAVPQPAANRTDQYNIFTQQLSAYDLYSQSVRSSDKEPTMTTRYPAFTGIELEPTAISENKLTFELPAPLSASFVDVIVANRAGYSRSSTEFFQSSDQSTANITTENIASSGMVMIGTPTFYYDVAASGPQISDQLISVTFDYRQTLIVDPFYDRSEIDDTVFIYNLSTESDMSNVIQTLTSSTFLNQVTFNDVDIDTTYYTQLTSEGGLRRFTNVATQTTDVVVFSAYEPDDEYYTQLTFKYKSTHFPTNIDYQYILASDENLNNIISTRTLTRFESTQQYVNLTRDTTYWAALSSEKLGIISNTVSAFTNPCRYFVVNLNENANGNTHTLDLSALPDEKIYVTEIISDKAKGMVAPIANDQFGNLFIAVGEGFFRPDRGNSPGRLVFDGGFPKFYGYAHEDMPKNSMLGSRVRFDHYQGNLWEHHNTYARWTTIHRDALRKGWSIYEGSIFPGQFAFLYNIFKYIQREENQTGKILYINDFKRNNVSEFPAYGVARFYSTFYDIAEHAGMKLEQLPGAVNGSYGAPKHDHVLAGLTPSLSSTEQWKSLFSGYDSIIWMGVNWNGEAGYNTENNNKGNYISQSVVDALENFYDNGGGLFVSTDHNYFQGCTTPVVSSYGIRFSGKVNRTNFHSAYKVETILNNTSYIPDGRHPLFEGLNPGSYIYAGSSEGKIIYQTGGDRLMINSIYTTNSNGELYIDKHNEGVPYTSNKIQVKTATGCVSAFNI